MPDDNNEATNNASGNGSDGKPGQTWEAHLATLPENVRKLHDEHVSGLKSALQSERSERSKAEKALRETAAKAEKGSELERQLTAQADEMRELTRKGNFLDAAHAAGARNLHLAYLAAKESSLVRDDGSADFAALKERYPELFGETPRPRGNAGNGTDSEPRSGDMNAVIRRMAGR